MYRYIDMYNKIHFVSEDEVEIQYTYLHSIELQIEIELHIIKYPLLFSNIDEIQSYVVIG